MKKYSNSDVYEDALSKMCNDLIESCSVCRSPNLFLETVTQSIENLAKVKEHDDKNEIIIIS